MVSRATCVALLFASLSLAGCGTVANVVRSSPETGGGVPFGGVKRDMACFGKGVDVKAAHGMPFESENYPRAACRVFCAMDLPFSLIGDIVTWPYVATYAFINQPVPAPPVTLAPPPPHQLTTPPMPIPTSP